MSSYDYHQLLKFLYFEGYADSYAEAENLLEEMTDEDFEKLLEAKDISQEVALKLADMLEGAPPLSRRGGISRGLRQFAIDRNKKRLAKLQQNEEIEKLDERKLAHSFPLKPSELRSVEKIRADLNNQEPEKITHSAPPRQSRTKRKLEYEVRENLISEIAEEKKPFPKEKVERQINNHLSKASASWSSRGGKSDPRKTHSYKARYRKMNAIKNSVERNEDPRNNQHGHDERKIYTKEYGTHVSAKTVDNEKSAYTPGGLRAHQTRAGGYRTLVRENFDEIAEYLFVEGYTDTIESAEVMVENISAEWANEILEAKVDWYNRNQFNVTHRVRVLRDRNKRNVDPSIPDGYKTASRRTRHELSRGKKNKKD